MPSAFELSTGPDGLATVTFDLPGRSVNVFNRPVMEELAGLIDGLVGRRDLRCLVLRSGKDGTFIAGADIDEISKITDGSEAEAAARQGQRVFEAWKDLPFPTVAAVRGTCVGGGTELALACDWIVISDREDVRIGLPEIRLGIVPGWGGCTRLPRKVGLPAALDVILAGKTLRPKKAFRIGLADALVPDASFDDEVRAFATRVAEGKAPPRRRRGGVQAFLLSGNPLGRKVVFNQARKQVLKTTKGHYPAPLRALEVVRTGVDKGVAAGLDAEARAIGELATTATARNLVHLFGLMEAVKKTADGAEPRPVRSAAVLGAGIMGGGIAQLLADKLDLPVRLKDIGEEQLVSGVRHAAGLFGKQVRRRWITKPEAARKLALIRPTLGYEGFGRIDLVIEAVVERLDVKRHVFAELEAAAPAEAVLATNTSSLSIDLIARDLERPERVVGMHFFNPVHKMPLVEVIRGSKTSDQAVATVMDVCRRSGKTPVEVKDGPGFLVNRLLGFTLAESMWLLDEGHRIEELDRAIAGWGMPMGPFSLTDEVGVDVAAEVSSILGGAFGDRLSMPEWFPRLVEDGRLGAKAGRGFYRYEKGRRAGVDPKVYKLIGVEPSARGADAGAIADRVVLPMLDEAARCLEEGVVGGAGQLDLAMILGTGFPPFRGGLCRWADAQGLDSLRGAMERLATQVGDRYAPSEAFVRTAEAGGFYSRFGGATPASPE